MCFACASTVAYTGLLICLFLNVVNIQSAFNQRGGSIPSELGLLTSLWFLDLCKLEDRKTLCKRPYVKCDTFITHFCCVIFMI